MSQIATAETAPKKMIRLLCSVVHCYWYRCKVVELELEDLRTEDGSRHEMGV